MRFRITVEIDVESEHKSKIIRELSDDLETFFSSKNYGEDIQNYLLGCICIRTKKGYEDWYKIRKPKYTDYKKTKNKLTGEDYEIIKTYENDFKLDNEIYEEFVSSTDEESKKILAHEILNSLSNLNSLPKKVNNFDRERFKTDLKTFFKEQNLI